MTICRDQLRVLTRVGDKDTSPDLRLQVEPASLGFHDGHGRVEGNEPVSVFLNVLKVGPDGQTEITRTEPVGPQASMSIEFDQKHILLRGTLVKLTLSGR